LQSAPGFHQFKAFTANISREGSHIACFDAHIILDDHITEELGEPNQSDSTEGDPQTLNSRGTTPEIGSTPIAEPNQSHLIEDFEAFEVNLPQQDYEQEESQVDNPTHELLC
jgi:hypothetical protein